MATGPGTGGEFGRAILPVAGQSSDLELMRRAAGVADRLGAELSIFYAPPDAANLTPWMGEGFVGGVQIGALEGLREAAGAGEAVARKAFAQLGRAGADFKVLPSPVGRNFACECRLADLVIFEAAAAAGGSPLSEMFQQVLMEERAAVLVLREGTDPFGAALVAWNGDEPAARAARRATPVLRHCASVTVVTVGEGDPHAEPAGLAAYYSARGVQADVRTVERTGEIALTLQELADQLDAGLIVAGAFGRSRLREFIFGGTTRALLSADQPCLFLAH